MDIFLFSSDGIDSVLSLVSLGFEELSDLLRNRVQRRRRLVPLPLTHIISSEIIGEFTSSLPRDPPRGHLNTPRFILPLPSI